jgi:hypothetical protein
LIRTHRARAVSWIRDPGLLKIQNRIQNRIQAQIQDPMQIRRRDRLRIRRPGR